MGTKQNPGRFDAYEKADGDEPMFTLLARDASAPALIEMWADSRERHGEEAGVVAEARECAEQMRAWRDHNRSPRPLLDDRLTLEILRLLGARGHISPRDCDPDSPIAQALRETIEDVRP